MSTNKARAPLRLITSSASAPVNRVLTGTRVAPAVSEPRAASTHTAELGAQIATRSPGAMPSAMSARATSRTRSCSSRYPSRAPPGSVRASASPNSLAALATAAGIVVGVVRSTTRDYQASAW